MKVAVLFSGGKDSFLTLKKVMEHEEVACLVTVISRNKESYMFHTPNVHLNELQSAALGIPLIKVETAGEKEKELKQLREAIQKAKKEYGIKGVASGAIASTYQSTRIQNICNGLGLWCFNPLWQRDQFSILKELRDNNFKVLVSGVFAYPFDEKWLGREIDEKAIEELRKMKDKYGINPAGEGGEIETLVVDSPLHKRSIKIKKAEKEYKDYAGVFNVIEAELVKK